MRPGPDASQVGLVELESLESCFPGNPLDHSSRRSAVLLLAGFTDAGNAAAFPPPARRADGGVLVGVLHVLRVADAHWTCSRTVPSGDCSDAGGSWRRAVAVRMVRKARSRGIPFHQTDLGVAGAGHRPFGDRCPRPELVAGSARRTEIRSCGRTECPGDCGRYATGGPSFRVRLLAPDQPQSGPCGTDGSALR